MAYEIRFGALTLQFHGGKKRPSDSYIECARYLEETFEKWIASDHAISCRELKEFMVMEQSINVGEKQKLIPPTPGLKA